MGRMSSLVGPTKIVCATSVSHKPCRGEMYGSTGAEPSSFLEARRAIAYTPLNEPFGCTDVLFPVKAYLYACSQPGSGCLLSIKAGLQGTSPKHPRRSVSLFNDMYGYDSHRQNR